MSCEKLDSLLASIVASIRLSEQECEPIPGERDTAGQLLFRLVSVGHTDTHDRDLIGTAKED